MPDLRVQLTRRADGAAVLRCVRADGTAAWQRHEGARAAFFPLHDLTHFAVETTLGFRHGFFGLLADGWEIADTEGKGARGPLPDEALLVEHVVGFLDGERVGGSEALTADALHHLLAQAVAAGRLARTRTFTDAELAAVRRRRDELHAAWGALAPGATLDLAFHRGRGNPPSPAGVLP